MGRRKWEEENEGDGAADCKCSKVDRWCFKPRKTGRLGEFRYGTLEEEGQRLQDRVICVTFQMLWHL